MMHIEYLQYDKYSLYDLPNGVLKNALMLQPIGEYYKIIQDNSIAYIYIDNNCIIHHESFRNAHWNGDPTVIDLTKSRQTHK